MMKAYGFLLRLYPGEHRKVFAQEMSEVFERSARDYRSRGLLAFAGFLLVETAGLLKGSLAEWITALRRGQNPAGVATTPDSAPAHLPADVIQVQQRIQYNLRSMEYAIAHHQFERARFFSNADRNERETLHRLWRAYGLEGDPDSGLNIYS